MVKLVAQLNAETLNVSEWGAAKFEVIEDVNNKFISVRTSFGFKNLLVNEVYLYDNKNVLIKVTNDLNTSSSKYIILYPNSFSNPYDLISLEVFDNKYRKAFNDNRMSIIGENTSRIVFSDKKWKDIKGIYNDIAIVNYWDNCHNLVRLNLGTLWSNELQGVSDIVHIQEALFKYSTPESARMYYLYNADNRKSSDLRTGYNDFMYISDQLAMGIIDNTQWDFINIHTMEVVYSSYEEPVIENDIIQIVSFDDNDEENTFKINFSGTRLSEGNVLDLNIESGEVVSVSDVKQEPVEEVKEVVVPIVTIGRFVYVNDDSIKLSEHSNLIYSKKSLYKPCNIEKGTVCWVLAKEKMIVITRRDGISDYRRAILYKKELPSDFDSFTVLNDSKWYTEDCFICTEEEDILDSAIETIKSKLQEKVDSIEIKQQTNENLVTNDTKETLKLKAIYHFLQQQGFDNDAIYKSLYILFPSIEQFIDLTNVKIANAELCKRIENHSRIRDLISSNTAKLIEMLNLSEKELAILNYYTKAKGLSISTAVEYISEESPTGTKVIAKYNELMRLGEILSNERKMLRELIIEDLVNRYANLADTSEILKPVMTSTDPDVVQGETNKDMRHDFTIDETKIIEVVIKDKIYKFSLNGNVDYGMFDNKKVYNFKHDIYYVQIGKDIIVFISKEKALELDNEHPHIITLRGNGEDKRFSQVFTHINGAIKSQRENNARIFVFAHNDNNTCKFYDELQYLNYDLVREDGREVIMFKLKSLVRFYTEQ